MTNTDFNPIIYECEETFDRYTVFMGAYVYGMSLDPLSPQGFNMVVGETCNDTPESMGMIERNEKQVLFTELPEQVQSAIKQRSFN